MSYIADLAAFNLAMIRLEEMFSSPLVDEDGEACAPVMKQAEFNRFMESNPYEYLDGLVHTGILTSWSCVCESWEDGMAIIFLMYRGKSSRGTSAFVTIQEMAAKYARPHVLGRIR